MRNKRILIVEDEPIIALELSERLQQYGYQIAGIAPTGKDAQKKFALTDPDLILLDISLKGEMNGIDFAEILRKNSDIPIIYLTAFSDQMTLGRAKLTQPSGFLLKPFNQRELETTIEISLYKYEMEKKIKANEKWLNATFNGINDGIITTDKTGKVNYINSAALQILYIKREEAIGNLVENFTRLYASFDEMEKINPIKKSIDDRHGSDIFLENFLINNNNERLIVEYRTTLLQDDFGNISGVILVLRDITQKKEIQAELKKSEERYKSVVEQISDGIIIYDFNTQKVLETNKAYRDMIGYSEQELLQMTSEQLVIQEGFSINQLKEILRKEKKFFIGERKHRRKDGTVIDVEVSADLFEIGEVDVLVVVVRNITERKRTEEAIRSSEEKLRILFDSMLQGVLYHDSNGIVVSANQSACKILGVKIDRLIGSAGNDPRWHSIHENGTPFIDNEYPYKIALKTGKEISGITMGILNETDHKYRWIVISSIPHIKQGENIPESIFTTFTDITELKNSEEALKKNSEELRHVIATKDKFFSIVAHDLKSPFLGLLGFTSALTEDYDQFDIAQVKRYINNINKASRNIYSLIQNLLEWSRLQTNKLELVITEVNLHQMAEYTINLLITNATNKNITIKNLLSPEELVIADERVLDSVFSNLISNAIKFSKKGGLITISSKNINHSVEVCIEDQGIGIEPEIMKDLFKLDVTVTTHGTDGETGTGLGLVLCQEMLEKLGGKIRVESEFKKGSKFFFELPKASS